VDADEQSERMRARGNEGMKENEDLGTGEWGELQFGVMMAGWM
jgi:hypothetical protein